MDKKLSRNGPVRAIVLEGIPGGSETTRVGFVKQVSFKVLSRE